MIQIKQQERSYFRRLMFGTKDLRVCVPVLDVLTSQLDPLSKPVDPSACKDKSKMSG